MVGHERGCRRVQTSPVQLRHADSCKPTTGRNYSLAKTDPVAKVSSNCVGNDMRPKLGADLPSSSVRPTTAPLGLGCCTPMLPKWGCRSVKLGSKISCHTIPVYFGPHSGYISLLEGAEMPTNISHAKYVFYSMLFKPPAGVTASQNRIGLVNGGYR